MFSSNCQHFVSKYLQNCLMDVLENWHSGVSVYIEGRVLESLVLLNYFHRYATFCHLKKCVCVTFVHKKSLIAKLISAFILGHTKV